MNIVNKLTLRHLKENKRRTLVTIIGVIISVAMLTAVSTLIASFMNLLQRDAIQSQGNWHVLYENVDKEQLEKIKRDELTDDLFIMEEIGYAPFEQGQSENKPYLYVLGLDQQGFKNYPVQLLKGRLPKNNQEVIISEMVLTHSDTQYKIGDQLTLDIGHRMEPNAKDSEEHYLTQQESLHESNNKITEILTHEITKTYDIVGIMEIPKWEPAWSPGITVLSYANEDQFVKTSTVNAAITVSKMSKALFNEAETFAKKNHIPSLTFNMELLRYYGVIKDDTLRFTLYSFSTIIIAIIMLGSISLIYNAFAISVAERSRHLGMLSSVGATKKQKRNSVFFEGAVIGLVSIPIGVISGIGGIWATFQFINPILREAINIDTGLELTVTPWSLLTACAISILTIFISTYIPAKRASRMTAIDAIRQSEDIKLTPKKVKTSRFVRKIFGIEAEIGLKNLKRNKRRYQATVFSLVISIILFLSVSFFTDNLQKTATLAQDGINFDLQIRQGAQTPEQWARLYDSIQKIDEITELSEIKSAFLNATATKDQLPKELREDLNEFGEDTFRYFINLYGLDEKSFATYLDKIGVSSDVFAKQDQKIQAIVIDTIPHHDYGTGKKVITKAIHTNVGDSIALHFYDWEQEKEFPIGQVDVATLTDETPMGVLHAPLSNLNIFVSSTDFEAILRQIKPDVKNAIEMENSLFMKSNDPVSTQNDIEKMTEVTVSMFNAYQARQQEEQMILVLKVFTYGFIILIAAISIANIFNTISTSISLRKREFAMLKSIGMTPKSFNKMIHYESIFYGLKALIYGIPLSIGVMLLMFYSLQHSFSYKFELPWLNLVAVVIGIFIIIGSAMLYASSKVKKANIIDALKQENI